MLKKQNQLEPQRDQILQGPSLIFESISFKSIKDYTVHELLVRTSEQAELQTSQWSIYHRYSEFEYLHENLREHKIKTPPFQNWVQKCVQQHEKSKQARCQFLQNYMNQLVSCRHTFQRLINNEVFLSFTGLSKQHDVREQLQTIFKEQDSESEQSSGAARYQMTPSDSALSSARESQNDSSSIQHSHSASCISHLSTFKSNEERIDWFLKSLEEMNKTQTGSDDVSLDKMSLNQIIKTLDYKQIEYTEPQFRRLLQGNGVKIKGLIQFLQDQLFQKEILSLLYDLSDVTRNNYYGAFEQSFAKLKAADLAKCNFNKIMQNDYERKYVIRVMNTYIQGKQQSITSAILQNELLQIFKTQEERNFFYEHYKLSLKRQQMRDPMPSNSSSSMSAQNRSFTRNNSSTALGKQPSDLKLRRRGSKQNPSLQNFFGQHYGSTVKESMVSESSGIDHSNQDSELSDSVVDQISMHEQNLSPKRNQSQNRAPAYSRHEKIPLDVQPFYDIGAQAGRSAEKVPGRRPIFSQDVNDGNRNALLGNKYGFEYQENDVDSPQIKPGKEEDLLEESKESNDYHVKLFAIDLDQKVRNWVNDYVQKSKVRCVYTQMLLSPQSFQPNIVYQIELEDKRAFCQYSESKKDSVISLDTFKDFFDDLINENDSFGQRFGFKFSCKKYISPQHRIVEISYSDQVKQNFKDKKKGADKPKFQPKTFLASFQQINQKAAVSLFLIEQSETEFNMSSDIVILATQDLTLDNQLNTVTELTKEEDDESLSYNNNFLNLRKCKLGQQDAYEALLNKNQNKSAPSKVQNAQSQESSSGEAVQTQIVVSPPTVSEISSLKKSDDNEFTPEKQPFQDSPSVQDEQDQNLNDAVIDSVQDQIIEPQNLNDSDQSSVDRLNIGSHVKASSASATTKSGSNKSSDASVHPPNQLLSSQHATPSWVGKSTGPISLTFCVKRRQELLLQIVDALSTISRELSTRV